MGKTLLVLGLFFVFGCLPTPGGGGGGSPAEAAASPGDPDPGSLPSTFSPTIEIALLGGSSVVIPLEPTLTPSGNFSFAGSQAIEETQSGGPTLSHNITWNFVVPSGNTGAVGELLFNGNLVVEVSPDAPAPRDFHIQITFPSQSYGNFTVAGGGTIKLNANSDGGAIVCPSDGQSSALLGIVADGEIAFALTFCPFTMTMTGSGTAQFPFVIATVTANQPPATILESTGIQLNASVSPGDKLTASLAPVEN